ncbi:DNA-directed DNA polymerase [Tanacetum coccineum]
MSIQLADRSIKYLIRVCENLLVKVGKFIFPVDFVILEMDEDELVLIILGWPFLATARAVIDVHEGKLSLRVGNETITFNIGKSMKTKHSREDYLYCTDHTSVEPLEWKAPENRLKPPSPKIELKELPEHLDYAFLLEKNQLPVVISSALSTDKKTRLLKVLRNHKGAIAWSIADIKGIDSSVYTHKILMEDKFKPSVQPQRRSIGNPCPSYPKKGRMTVVKNEKDELIPQRTVTGWRMLERLVGHEYYCFLDGFSGYFQIPIIPEDQEKTTFTCPYRTFAYKRMPFGLCNAPATFQRCMTSIFHELIEDNIEVFMDNFSVFDNSFDYCLKNLEKMRGNQPCTKLGKMPFHADHLSRLENPDLGRLTGDEIRDLFPEEQLVAVFDKNNEPWNNRKDWSYKLDDALWAFRTAFKTPLGTTSFRIIYGKACHLPVKFEHKAYWAIKNCNMDLTKAGENWFLQINELDEMRLDAYESSISYKERTKRLFPGKLKSRWYGLFLVSKDMKNGAIELYDEEGSEFIVNKQRVKPYQNNLLDINKDDDVTLKNEGEVT